MTFGRATSLVGIAVALGLPTPCKSQALTGRVITGDSTAGVPGAIVVLMDAVHAELTRTLSRADGRFTLRAAMPGIYGVRVLRIGFRPDDFGPFAVGTAGTLSLLLPLTERAITLATVTVSGQSECRAASEGGAASLTLWEEARKNLLVAVLTRDTRTLSVTTATYERVEDPNYHRQIALRVRGQTGASVRPFVSPLSADEYASRGFMEADGSGSDFRAPDADVLLSDSFLATHCMRLVASGDTSIVGLGFRPIRTEQGHVDVEGVLWLNRAHAELRSIDVSYVGLSDAMRDAGAGASLTLNPVLGGGEVVSDWVIRVPRAVKVKGFRASPGSSMGSLMGRSQVRDSIAELWYIGGSVLRARAGETVVWRGHTARLEGRVTEDGSARPIVDVRVDLVGTNYATITNSAGVFMIADVLPGEYEVRARSSQLEALGLDAPATAQLAFGDSTSRATIQMLPVRKVLARICAMSDTLGAVQGKVEDAGGRGVGNARVMARWLATVRDAGNELIARWASLTISTGADGRFRLCGLPRNHNIGMGAVGENLAVPRQTIRLDSSQDLAVVTLTGHRSGQPATADGLGAVAGTVWDESGALLNDVDIDLAGVGAVRTDSLGRFNLAGLEPGTFLLRARRVGWSAPVAPVTVEFGLRTTRDVVMQHVQQLSGMTVSASAGGQGGFARRRANGSGTFLTEEQIATRNARTTEALLETLPGVALSVDRRVSGAFITIDRGAVTLQGTQCNGVAVFVDGTEVPEDFNVAHISPRELKGVELYRGASSTPPELRSTRTICGTLVLWLK